MFACVLCCPGIRNRHGNEWSWFETRLRKTLFLQLVILQYARVVSVSNKTLCAVRSGERKMCRGVQPKQWLGFAL